MFRFSHSLPVGRDSVAQLHPLRLALAVAVFILVSSMVSAATVDFDSFNDGELVSGQLHNIGVDFSPWGVFAIASARARSAPNFAIAPQNGEFERRAFRAEFGTGQDEVSLWVEAERDLGTAHTASLKAYGLSGSLLDTATVNFTGGSGWRQLTVTDTDGTPSIRRIELTGGQVIFPTTNFLIADDLYFNAVITPPPDETPPVISITAPPTGTTITASFLDVAISASDNENLLTVTGDITHLGSATTVGAMDYCGSGSSGACSNPISRSRSVSLSPPLEGTHRIEVTACDASSNCASATRDFEVDLPAPPADVIVTRVEINQGVQDRLFVVGEPGVDLTAFSPVQLLGGRDTVVRFYPLADGAVREGYSARLTARIHYQDGSVVDRFTYPNAGISSVTVQPDPVTPTGRDDAYVMMRTDLTTTLNYVLPGSILDNASRLDVRLEIPGVITGWVGIDLRPEVRLAVWEVRLFGPGIPGGTTGTPGQMQENYSYLEESYPATRVIRLTAPPALIMIDPYCEIFVSRLQCASWQFNHYNVPGPIPVNEDPTYLVALGYVPFGSFGRVGITMNHSAIAMPYSDAAAAHEVGHAVGRPHAGGAHGEAGGETWPNPHGLMGVTDFGVITFQTGSNGAGDPDLRAWDLTLVDPCPGASLALRRPNCGLPVDPPPPAPLPAGGVGTHDFMSYGDSVADLGPLSSPTSPIFSRNWVSSYTWTRLYNKMHAEGFVAGSSAVHHATTEASEEMLLIDAVVDESGTFQQLPVLEVNPGLEDEPDTTSGPYELELQDPDGGILYTRNFDVTEWHAEGDEPVYLMDQLVPLQPNLHRVRVTRDAAVVMDRTASAHRPTVEVLYPDGGETLDEGSFFVTWEAEDLDGDPLISRVDYSPDQGSTWLTLGMVGRDDPAEIEVDTATLAATDRALFRVMVSDGFLTASDRSDCPVAINSPEPLPCSAGLCEEDATGLCLAQQRFRVEVSWRTPDGQTGSGMAVPLTSDTGFFWFFREENVEAVIKVLDACAFNERFWVFAGGLTDVEATITVTDTQTDQVRSYTNPLGTTFQPIQDTDAFATCSGTQSAAQGVAALDGTGELLLNDDRFRVEMEWATQQGESGEGIGVELTSDTGYFWFFRPSNVEAVVKVLDACSFNGRFWVFAGGLTDVETTLIVTDTATGQSRSYQNPQGTPFQPIQDTDAFATCP